MVHCLVLWCPSDVRLPLLLGSLSALVCALSFVSCPHDCCSLMMMKAVASSETSVSVYQAIRYHIPEGLLFTFAALRTLNLAFLRSRDKEKRKEEQVAHPMQSSAAPVLTGHYFICKRIWVVVIINV